VPRDIFVPPAFRERAYDNVALPIGHGQTISQPYVVALMTEALELTERHIVLEIGTGSGYQAAVLARLARRVFTVERHRAMQKTAEERFKQLRLSKITCRFGDGTKGWPEQPSFESHHCHGAGATIPDALVNSLSENGVLVRRWVKNGAIRCSCASAAPPRFPRRRARDGTVRPAGRRPAARRGAII